MNRKLAQTQVFHGFNLAQRLHGMQLESECQLFSTGFDANRASGGEARNEQGGSHSGTKGGSDSRPEGVRPITQRYSHEEE